MGDDAAGPVRGRGRRRRLAAALVLLAAATFWSFGAMSRVADLRAYRLASGSMAPTLRFGDKVLVDESAGPKRPSRGEVWAFMPPAPAAPRGTVWVKRVIGLPGETIAVRAGRVLVDGRPLDEPYVVKPSSDTVAPKTLGPDEFFLMGDARTASTDSRVWGALPRERLLGRVRQRYWPPERIGGL